MEFESSEVIVQTPGLTDLSPRINFAEGQVRQPYLDKIKDMIARNPKNHEDRWRVANHDFETNFRLS